jgi:hypothetical protein
MRRALEILVASVAMFALGSTITARASAQTLQAGNTPTVAGVPPDDRIRLAEAFRLAAAVGNDLWPAWTSAPFAVLLVTADREYLIRHPRPSPDFVRVGYDSLLASDVYSRARKMSPTFLATFPAVSGVSTIVVGQPAATRKASTPWVLTILHEHFHQLQHSLPGYYEGVDALGLARGDQTGMWMLNYAFPYDSAKVQERVADLMSALSGALDSVSPAHRTERWRAVADARRRLREVLPSDDDRYLAFQMWQEGVARYTELTMARWAAEHYTPSDAFRALPDYASYADVARELERDLRAELRNDALARDRRVVFYPAGAATALLLDALAPDWRARYFAQRFSLDGLAPR